MGEAVFDDIAGWYDEAIRRGPQSLHHGLVVPIVLDLAGDVEGLSVCDVGCGQGVVARGLADNGASVFGADISSKLLGVARRYERDEPRGVVYERGDAQVLDGIEDAAFDGVLCNLVLMDVPDLDACLSSVARVLRPGGWLVFSITHPCFQAPNARWSEREHDGSVAREVGDYFTEGYWHPDTEGVRGKAGTHHRTISTYVNDLARAGFVIERFVEPRATGSLAGLVPGYRVVPPHLISRCRKPMAGG